MHASRFFGHIRNQDRHGISGSNLLRAVALTFEQFQYGFANAVDDDEARELYEQFHVAGSRIPILRAALANSNPRTEAKADATNPDRGPLLISGEKDHQAALAIAEASYRRPAKNSAVTEMIAIPNRGHSLTIDSGWQDVARTCLAQPPVRAMASDPSSNLDSVPDGEASAALQASRWPRPTHDWNILVATRRRVAPFRSSRERGRLVDFIARLAKCTPSARQDRRC